MSRYESWRAPAAMAATAFLIGGGVAFWVLGFGGLDRGRGPAADSRLSVFTGIPPVAYLVERIGGDRVRVEVLVPPGQSPHTFEPTPRQAAALAGASLFFKDDMPFENRLVERLADAGGRLIVVDTTAGIVKRAAERDADEPQMAARSGDHATTSDRPGGEPDPHVWLAPLTLRAMASNIAAALGRADPQHDAEYRKNLAGVTADLDALNERIARTLAPYRGRTFYVYHPAFGYFADAYGLKQQTVEMEGKSPTPGQLRALIGHARAERVKVIFLQPQFDPRSAEAVAAAIDGKVVPLDPLAKDVIGNLTEMAAKIESAMAGTK